MNYFIFAMLPALFFAACSAEKGNEKMLSEITYLEEEIGADPRPAPAKLDSLMQKMESYATAFPDDSLSAGFLARAGEIARLNGHFDQALAMYDRILKHYEGKPEAAKALFMKGFTLDNDLKKMEEAKVVYEEFLKKYPNDDFADDAGFLLKNLGKTEDEIIREFEAAGEKTPESK